MDDCQLFLLDDYADIYLLVEHALSDICSLTCCATCREARALLTTRSFDILMLDLRLPDGSGIDMLRYTRRQATSRNVNTPAIAMTAQVLPKQEERLLNHGFDAYLPKPFSKTEIRTVVHEQMAMS